MPPRATAEQWWRGLLRGPGTTKALSATNQWAGQTAIASGTATVTVSTTVVGSDSLILAGIMSNTPAGSVGLGVHVSTISPGNFFTLATADGQNTPRPLTVMWLLWKTS